MMDNQKMELIQHPIIKHRLEEIGDKVSKRFEELNLDNQIVTEDAIKALKSLRADLNKESKDFEDQRKIIKDAVLSPYNNFEVIYKEQISEKYREADAVLKEKINDFEIKIKLEKKENIISYFEEIRDMEELNWLKFEQLNIEINLSTSEKKYKEQVLSTIQKIVDDLDLIKTEEYAAEMLVEYKPTLNASASIKLVRDRKEKERLEKGRILFERNQNRVSSLRSLQFISHDLTRTYNWIQDESIMVSYSDVENLSDEDWTKKYAELEGKAKKKEEPKVEVLKAPEIKTPVVVAPVKEREPVAEIFEAKFIVKGTYDQIKALGEFMKSNNYEYQNID